MGDARSTGTVRAGAGMSVGTARLTLDAPGILAIVGESIAIAGTARVRAAGMSMWPTIRDGSIVTLGPKPSALRPGQIVLLDWGGRPVLHRIVRIDGELVQTCGDACLDLDPPTSLSHVHAVATCLTDARGAVTLTGSPHLGVRSLLHFIAARVRLSLARRWRAIRPRAGR